MATFKQKLYGRPDRASGIYRQLQCCRPIGMPRLKTHCPAHVPVSFLEKLKARRSRSSATASDPWRLCLARVRGKVDFDGLERISTQSVMDVLEVPQRERTAGAYRH